MRYLCTTQHTNVFFLPPGSPAKGVFILESEPLKRCVTVDRSNLVLEDCERPTRRMLWKWVSRHRLFNLGTSSCLGLNVSDTTQPLGTFECDTALPVLWWRCSGNGLYGASHWKVSVAGRLVVVKKNSYHGWKRYNTPGEGPCSYPYEGKARACLSDVCRTKRKTHTGLRCVRRCTHAVGKRTRHALLSAL